MDEVKNIEPNNVQSIDIVDKVRSSYLDYAMSVITARALPDVRDGLKPVQRLILYAMHDMHLTHDQPTRKSARIVGEVIGKYHPHSDTAIYDAMVRMAQDFTMRYALVEGQGNFGSVDGDGAAAIRYTEARLARLGEEMLTDLDMNTVDFVPNYDGSTDQPTVLPAKLPNLLVNGTSGIAVGMATNIPPHNLGEVADAICYVIDHLKQVDDISVDDLMGLIHGPDFPTGGAILGDEGIRLAYATGKGTIMVRARAHVEDIRGGHSAIIVTELPFQVNKANLIERIAGLVRDGRVEGITDLRDESDRTGMRIVIELKRGLDAEPVLVSLLKLTQMQGSFGINMLALVDGEPRTLPLKRILVEYIEHRRIVIRRRSEFELERALARAHILEGLLKALDQLDEVIQTIRRSRTADTALTNLMEKFKFSELQARAILDMQLRRLAALERQRIEDEYREIKARIAYLQALLKDPGKILALVKEDVLALKAAYGDPRRTRIIIGGGEGTVLDDMVPDEESLVVVTTNGLIRRIPFSQATQATQAALSGFGEVPDDSVRWVMRAHSKDTLCLIGAGGRAQLAAAHQVPDTIQQERGIPLGNLVRLPNDEPIAAIVVLPAADEERFLTTFTRLGKVKRSSLAEVAGLGAGGILIGIADDDAVLTAFVTDGKQELLAVSAQGRALRFNEDEVRPQGRTGGGVRAMDLASGDALVGTSVVNPEGMLVIVSEEGFAKRCALKEFSLQRRGGQGLLVSDAAKASLSGALFGSSMLTPQEDLVLVTSAHRMLRREYGEIPVAPRAGWGRIVSASKKGALVVLGDDRLAGIFCVPAAPTASAAPTRAASAEQATLAGMMGAEPAPKRVKASPTARTKASTAKPSAQTELPKPATRSRKATRESVVAPVKTRTTKASAATSATVSKTATKSRDAAEEPVPTPTKTRTTKASTATSAAPKPAARSRKTAEEPVPTPTKTRTTKATPATAETPKPAAPAPAKPSPKSDTQPAAPKGVKPEEPTDKAPVAGRRRPIVTRRPTRSIKE